MKRSRWRIADVLVLTFVAFAGVAGGAAVAAAPKKGVDAEAERMLRQMTDYLAGLQSFTVRTSVMDETALKTGEKIQTMSGSNISVARPNRLHSTQRGGPMGLGLWYDGKTMSVACKASNSYQTIAAPPHLDQAIDKMRKEFVIDAPGADLLYSRPYDILMEQVVSGRVIGKETVQGAAANHLAFQGEEVDFQIWIQDGHQPLPLRFVITSKKVKGQPQFTVQLSNWDTMTKLSAADFAFVASAGAKPVPSVTSSCTR
jgi:hypothetical protein